MARTQKRAGSIDITTTTDHGTLKRMTREGRVASWLVTRKTATLGIGHTQEAKRMMREVAEEKNRRDQMGMDPEDAAQELSTDEIKKGGGEEIVRGKAVIGRREILEINTRYLCFLRAYSSSAFSLFSPEYPAECLN